MTLIFGRNFELKRDSCNGTGGAEVDVGIKTDIPTQIRAGLVPLQGSGGFSKITVSMNNLQKRR